MTSGRKLGRQKSVHRNNRECTLKNNTDAFVYVNQPSIALQNTHKSEAVVSHHRHQNFCSLSSFSTHFFKVLLRNPIVCLHSNNVHKHYKRFVSCKNAVLKRGEKQRERESEEEKKERNYYHYIDVCVCMSERCNY